MMTALSVVLTGQHWAACTSRGDPAQRVPLQNRMQRPLCSSLVLPRGPTLRVRGWGEAPPGLPRFTPAFSCSQKPSHSQFTSQHTSQSESPCAWVGVSF